MPKINWRAKVMYLAIVLALAIGLVPGLAAAADSPAGPGGGHGSARLSCYVMADRYYAPISGLITFYGYCNLGSNLDTWTWDIGTGALGGLSVPADLSGTGLITPITVYWGSSGEKQVELTVTEGNLTAYGHEEVMIDGYALEPAIAHNVLGTYETFTVPAGVFSNNIYAHVVGWRVEEQDQIDVSVVSGTGDPGDKSITVHCTGLDTNYEGGAAYIYADISLDEGGTVDQVYEAEKKWGKIDDTMLIPMVPVYDSSYDGGSGYQGDFVITRLPEYVPATTSSSMITWNESKKQWEGGIWMNEVVLGSYDVNKTPENPSGLIELPADGAIVHWYLLDGDANVASIPTSGSFDSIDAAIQALPEANHVEFNDYMGNLLGTYTTTTSGDMGYEGVTGVSVDAVGEESVYIIAVATYPDQNLNDPLQYPVFPEIVTWNFWTQQIEKVPQVRWVEEKIVLEKNWGTNYDGNLVHYAISSGSGTLENVDMDDVYTWDGGLNETNNANSVWTVVEGNGVSRCILTSPDAGEVHVTVSLYDSSGESIINQHEFVVYFLKLYSVTLGNPPSDENGVTRVDNPLTGTPLNPVIEGHNSGLWWNPDNVWDASQDVTQETLNVSQDALLRARVKGYFYGNQMSSRPEKWIDLDPTVDSGNYDEATDSYVLDGITDNDKDLYLPAGYWVLPDDWARLAGPKWQQLRPHWDIMDQPNDNIMSDADDGAMDKLGSYVYWGKDLSGLDVQEYPVADWPVIGPYSSLDTYTPDTNYPLWRKTIVPNGLLNSWDCPMPPAKIAFEITGPVLYLDDSPVAIGLGYFKEVDKGDVYYKLLNQDANVPNPDSIAYTNPYYAEMIPARYYIPPFANNMGYDWDSWNWTDYYGPYPFWEMINQPPGVTYSDPQHPTKVWVYSDNHGEAMVWLNGDWNLNTDDYWQAWTEAVSNGETVPVGSSTVVAIADYPYGRGDPAQVSNEVTKDWTWGKEKIVDVFHVDQTEQSPYDYPQKLILVWITDRDGMPAVGEEVDWQLPAGVKILSFLVDTDGTILDSPTDTLGVSYARLPYPEEVAKFELLHPGLALGAVAGIEVLGWDGGTGQANILLTLNEREGTLTHSQPLDFTSDSQEDPALTAAQLNTGTYEGPTQSIVAATETIKNDLVAIWWQDGAGVWHAYQPGAPDWANDLSEITQGESYWVKVGQDCFWNWNLS